ncbi:MAG: UDP-glucose 4-epimerase GalE [Flavobacteriales bacterium]|nr:UDP-glucose 4-epimerase GalE [Flavobacteriales bacterium]|tara:strand:- start:78 stop:1085 length:1008 start_codon:yes stop_codon:yes gene_type:complete
MKKVIITGGAGYIGSHTAVALHSAGFTPIIIDNLSNSSEYNIIGISKLINYSVKWYNIDCLEYEKLYEIFKKEQEIIGVIHFAAFKSIKESIKKPKKYFENNIGSLKNIISIMEILNIKNLLFSSSCTVYGEPKHIPVEENADFKAPLSPYSETKQICEKMLEKTDLNTISLRFFNPIGNHSSNLIGDCSKSESNNLVPLIAQAAVGKRKFITVNGDNYNTSDGSCIRDFINVIDLSNAHIYALEYLIKNQIKKIFNIGTGKGISVLEIIKYFEKSNNLKINYKIGPRRSGDVEAIFANVEAAKKELKWNTQVSIEDSMKTAFSWEETIYNQNIS